MNFELILGGPGTGKTEHLVQLVERLLAAGECRPDELAFVSFTRAAVDEARQRAAEALNVSQRKLTHFRTLHSLCFNNLGLRRGDVLEGAALKELEELTGEQQRRDLLGGEAGPWEIESLARTIGIDPYDAAREAGLDFFRFSRAVKARARFKKDRNLLDFTDMLERYTEVGLPLHEVKVAIIDEAQDLTPLQWRVVEHAFSDTPRVIVAGDDDQAIHEWAGSTITPLVHHRGQRHTLEVSHRLPSSVHALAGQVANQLSVRIPKVTRPTERAGLVEWHRDPTEVPLSETPGTWLLLARARYQLEELVATARQAGVPYSVHGRSGLNQELLEAAREYEAAHPDSSVRWHDALDEFPIEDREFLLACRRGGEHLNVAPRVQIDTVHGAKGRQADHVLLLTDLTHRVYQRAQADPDAERRVCYVGLTRPRESLHLVEPRGPYSWRI